MYARYARLANKEVPLLILTASDVRELLPMDACIERVAEALASLSAGEAAQPLRKPLPLTNSKGIFGVMPAQLGTPAVAGLKAICIMPGNHALGLDSHMGTVVLFEIDQGRPIALLDAATITAIRTAAASGLATRLMARDDAGDLAIIGSGVQAHSHLDAMREVRRLRRVRVWSRTAASARAFADRASARAGLVVEPMPSARAAVEGADLVCTVSGAVEPVVEGAWIASGAHINAVGACTAHTRELDGAAMARARVITDCRESAENEAGNLILAQNEGMIDDGHLCGELGEVVRGRLAGRTSDDEVTVFQSLGVGVEDLAAGYHVYQQALAQGRGTEVDLDA